MLGCRGWRHRAIEGRGEALRDRPAPRYFCVRLSWNGEHLHQLCDPNDPTTGRTTGVVRAAVEEFFNDLKRGHFIDRQTRALTLTMPLRSNFLGVRSRVTLMIETTATGTVLPSYDIETRVESFSKQAETRFYVDAALALCAFFAFSELIEIFREGPISYAGDPWNCLDMTVLALAYGERVAAATGGALTGLSAFKAVRALRALRPLRAVKRLAGLGCVHVACGQQHCAAIGGDGTVLSRGRGRGRVRVRGRVRGRARVRARVRVATARCSPAPAA